MVPVANPLKILLTIRGDSLMALKHAPLSTGRRIPHSYHVIVRARHDKPAVGREGDGINPSRMSILSGIISRLDRNTPEYQDFDTCYLAVPLSVAEWTIAKRQIEPAQLSESQSQSQPNSDGAAAPAAKSIKNKRSTESLRPADEPEAHPRETTPKQCSPSDPQSSSAIARQTSQARAAGQARARATLRRRQSSDSMISAEDAASKHQTRSMIIVCYDSYVQLFFEDLVKFVSASRHMMRKPNMAAKLAQMKRLAELDMPESSNGRGAAAGIPGVDPLEPDVYDHLDKGLEDVQNMCEEAAHQFLHDKPEALKAAEDEMRVLLQAAEYAL
ncbi:hypothetical protein QBC46DRAFT_348553 [Diplogelasinospora grovesii]|uniref:Uncharacterized protein n=1 Tax=Diplogelasinospora grovesii TaxID=303347 RepID=A0AAN6RYU0_9PEZI|nr:hypothetical protein QBC46DRAFT_348553 [Diplogelasinospora grovesii]